MHRLELRFYNGSAPESIKRIDLGTGGDRSVAWRVQVENPAVPWVGVIIPDDNLTRKQELFGDMRAEW